jgi:hypothetical protein
MDLVYHITNDAKRYDDLEMTFLRSYDEFCGEKSADYFSKIRKEASCASIIYRDQDVYAFCFHREMFCASPSEPPQYLADTPSEFLNMIAGKYQILTIEWLTVAPQFLGKFSKVQPADLILGLGFTLAANSICNASMGYSRQDNRMDVMTTRYGATLNGTVTRFNLPCSVVFLDTEKMIPHKISKIQSSIESLWNNRINEVQGLERKRVA